MAPARVDADAESLRDRLRVEALPHVAEHLELPAGEPGRVARVLGGGTLRVTQPLDQGGEGRALHEDLVVERDADGVDDLLQRALLRQEPGRAGRGRLREDVQLGVAGQDQDARVRVAGLDAPRPLDAVDAGKVDVHQDHVGRVLLGELQRRFDARRGTDALEVGLRVDGDRDRLREREVIVDDQHPLCHLSLRGRLGPARPGLLPLRREPERSGKRSVARRAAESRPAIGP